MRRLLLLIAVTVCVIFPVQATDFTAPSEPVSVEKYLPNESVTFGKDLWYIIRSALEDITPEISDAINVCASVLAVQLLIAVVQGFSGIGKKTVMLAGVTALSAILLGPSKILINMGLETIHELCDYNRLLVPVMTASLATQGGATSSAALYAGTVVLDSILTLSVTKVLLPMLYSYIALALASVMVIEPLLNRLLDFIKCLITWSLKITLYVFTGYMGITGIISGTVDATTVKATKMAISGGVPVIGKMISDASETILLGAGIVKNTAGISGALVILAIWILPFLKIGVQYILLKLTVGISSLYADKTTVSLVQHFCSVMGFVLATIGTICLLFLVSIVCFLKGMNG